VDSTTLIIVLAAVVVVAAIAALLLFRRRGPGRIDMDRVAPLPTDETRNLRARMTKTRAALGASLNSMFRSGGETNWGDLEDALILSDVGPSTSADVVSRVRKADPKTTEELSQALFDVLVDTFGSADRSLNTRGAPGVVIVVGVNGAGKTTTIAKIANDLVRSDISVVLAAADTFRAAADSQLVVWADRIGVDVVTGPSGSDPASVAFGAVDKAKEEAIDVVIVDTAGRLHAHTNLMDELSKIARVTEREAGAISEVLLVLDGSTGQNGIAQARAFTEAVPVTGVVVTKLDGTAKGGVAVAIEHDLGLPIKYIGIGEGIDDLIPFEPREFVRALIR
jgi:fused signal recognition particle receptor